MGVLVRLENETNMTPKEKASKLTAEWLRDNLAYEPETGSFLWKKRGFGRTLGKVLGTKIWPGYLTIKVHGTVFYAHRLAWLYVHGVWPDGHVDHIDGQKANNAMSNLRLATASQNVARRAVKRTVAPARGVMRHGVGFVARIHYAGKKHYLGYFPTLDGARDAYQKKAKEVHGEFAHVEPEHDWRAPASYMGLGFSGMN